jgi:hypothetical protein
VKVPETAGNDDQTVRRWNRRDTKKGSEEGKEAFEKKKGEEWV